jgi:hypothetical protein
MSSLRLGVLNLNIFHKYVDIGYVGLVDVIYICFKILGTTYNPLRQFPLPDKFNYDWLLNYTVSQETENTMFNENENKNYADVETLPGSLDYEKVFGTPDQKSGEFTVHPGINSSEFSDWNPSEETLKELRNVSRVMQSMTFNTDYYEVDGVKYTPPLVDIPEVNIDDYTGDIPDWYKKFEKEVIEKWTLPTIKTSKKWRWMVSRDRERARLSSLGLLTPWPTTTKYTGDPFEDSNDSYFNNDLVFNATES